MTGIAGFARSESFAEGTLDEETAAMRRLGVRLNERTLAAILARLCAISVPKFSAPNTHSPLGTIPQHPDVSYLSTALQTKERGMRRELAVPVALACATLGFGSPVLARSWFKKHVAHPIERHVVAPVVAGSTQAFYTVSDGAQKAMSGVDYVDSHTLQPAKHLIGKNAIQPAVHGASEVVGPVTHVMETGLGKTFDALHMNPVGGSYVPFGKDFDRAVGTGAHKLHVNRELTQSILDPTRIAGRVTQQAKQDLPVLAHTVVREAASGISLNPTRPIGSALGSSLSSVNVAGNAVTAAARPALLLDDGKLFMKRPHWTEFGADRFHDQSPVYYVNGVHVSRPGAELAAQRLSDRLHRPVRLIYNNNNGVVIGGLESTYDRLSPLIQPGPLKALQGNDTTRQLTYLLMHPPGGQRLDIICHSQGCLIVRNAIDTAGAMGRGAWIRHNLRVIFCAPPFVNAELNPKPAKTEMFSNSHDFVSQGLGGRLTNKTNRGNGHGFLEDYLPQISPRFFN